MSKTVICDADVQIWEQVVAPGEPNLSGPVARAISSLRFSDKQTAEMHRLLDKNNAGTITDNSLTRKSSRK